MSQLQPLFLQRIAAIPGIRSACLAQVWYARYVGREPFLVDDQSLRPDAGMALSKVTPQYFPTLGIPIVQGRNFTEEEAKGEAPVFDRQRIFRPNISGRAAIPLATGSRSGQPTLRRL